jgi:large subunit ribosomal protein L35
MPKMKSHRGAAKRFKSNKAGNQIKFKRAHLRHNLSSKSTQTKRELAQTGYVDSTDFERVTRMLRGE